MIVDDEPFIRQGFRLLIPWENYGFQVVYEAANGLEAINILEKDPVDFVFADIKMPGMSGIELIEYTSVHLSKHIKFIILSGYYQFSYAKAAIRCNVLDYLLKPIQKDELITLLQELHTEYKKENEEDKYEVDKKILDEFLQTLEDGDKTNVMMELEKVKNEFTRMKGFPESIKVSIDYILYHLVHSKKDKDQSQEEHETFRGLTETEIETMIVSGDFQPFEQLVEELCNQILQMRQNQIGGIINDIDREIDEHYMENLSLKSLSEKYYINCAYLGQIFKKKHGVPFKDYLNRIRIEKASQMLKRNELKVYQIGAAVGYNNTDYFISKFVQQKGTTPLQYRKQYFDLE